MILFSGSCIKPYEPVFDSENLPIEFWNFVETIFVDDGIN